ncbi:hypothetical protein KEM60_03137 [Austwickia sp. TVS 96-490-7B]|uniref:ABC transporter permease n=1 Tax=Austwickia sp. TVS 96-490-7B TaxID=2830843 RepID=UPI001C55FB03|nr:FtsX-like permease family protein [Austwickia sp. TVS 96-490-7B]MBW3086908.1 hypothetical protein [Austwickia sp. TVS 96-490-7B]
MAQSKRPASGPTIPDLLRDSFLTILGRTGSAIRTACGVSIGIAAAVATLIISTSAAGAISDRFDERAATRVTAIQPSNEQHCIDTATAQRATQVNGVIVAGGLCQKASLTAVTFPEAPPFGAKHDLHTAYVDASTADALSLVIESGRFFDAAMVQQRHRVAVVDIVAAKEIGLTWPVQQQSLWIDGFSYHIIGVTSDPSGAVTGRVLIPSWAAPPKADIHGSVIVRTALGAADQVAAELPLALDPSRPTFYKTLVQASLGQLREEVSQETQFLVLGLSLVSLLVGAIGVANTMLIAVLERRAEIGLRVALGSTKRTIAALFFIEGAYVGALGGVIGVITGVLVSLSVCVYRGWIAVLDVRVCVVGLLVGALVGMLAAVWPAVRAAQVSPAASLRGL